MKSSITNVSRIGMIINLARFHPEEIPIAIGTGQVVTYINQIKNT
ncbi:hypothetical protein [Algoriphagus aquimarinus]